MPERRPASYCDWLYELDKIEQKNTNPDIMYETHDSKKQTRRINMSLFVINLKKDTYKKKYIEQHFKEYGVEEYQFIDAVYGAQLSEEALAKVYDEKRAIQVSGRKLLKGEIGCALSHYKCYKNITQNQLPGAFIFEDDCCFNDKTLEVMQDISESYSGRASEDIIILLTHVKLSKNRIINKLRLSQASILEVVYPVYATHGYYVTNKAAQNLLEDMFPVHHVIDDWKFLNDRRPERHIYSTFPYCVTSTDKHKLSSTIEIERVEILGKPSIKEVRKQRNYMSKMAAFFREHVRRIRYLVKNLKYQNDKW